MKRLTRVALYGALTLAALTFVYPFLWMASSSLKPASEVGTRRSCAFAGAASAVMRARAAMNGLSGKEVMGGPGGSVRSTYRAGIGRKMAAGGGLSADS